MKSNKPLYTPGFIRDGSIKPDVEIELRRIAEALRGLLEEIKTDISDIQEQSDALQRDVATLAKAILDKEVH